MMMNNVPQTTISQDRVIPASSYTKKCFRCDKVLPLSEFGKTKSALDGHFHDCKKCKIAQRQEDMEADRLRKEWFAKILEQNKLTQLAFAKIGVLEQELSTYHAKQARTETLVADTEIKIDQMMKYYAKEIKRDFNTIMFQFNHDLKAHAKDVT